VHGNNVQKKIISEHDTVQSIILGILEINNDNSIQTCLQFKKQQHPKKKERGKLKALMHCK
jgi:hypothetical protein